MTEETAQTPIAIESFYTDFGKLVKAQLGEIYKEDKLSGYVQIKLQKESVTFKDDANKIQYGMAYFSNDLKFYVDVEKFKQALFDMADGVDYKYIISDNEKEDHMVLTIFNSKFNPKLNAVFEEVKKAKLEVSNENTDSGGFSGESL